MTIYGVRAKESKTRDIRLHYLGVFASSSSFYVHINREASAEEIDEVVSKLRKIGGSDLRVTLVETTEFEQE